MSDTEKKPKAKKGLGCFSRFLILIVVVIVLVIVGVKLFFPVEKVKAAIVEKASTALNRHVELDDVSFSIFPGPGLELTGLRIYNPEDFAGGEFVSVDGLRCGLKFMPLLKKQFEFTEITIDHPVLRLRKAPDGRVNYSFEIKAGEEPIQTPVGPKESVSSEEAAMSAFGFDWAEIVHGDIIYTDDSSNYTVTMSNVSLKTRLQLDADGKTGQSSGTLHIPSISSELIPNKLPLDFKVNYNAKIDFEHTDLVLEKTGLEINGILFDLDATVRRFTDPISIFAKLSASDVALDPLRQYIPVSESFDPDQLRLQGTLTGNLETRIEMQSDRTPYFGGQFTMNKLALGYGNIAGRLECSAMKLDFTADSVSFATQGGQLSGKPFDFSGVISNWDDINYRVKTNGQYDLSGIVPFLDPELHNDIRGNTTFDLSVSGIQSTWATSTIRGDLRVSNLYYNNDSLTSALERLDMRLNFAKDKISVDTLYAEYPGVVLSLKGQIKNGLAHLLEPRKGHKKPHLTFAMYSPGVDYDVLVPEESIATPVAQKPAGGGTASQPATGTTPATGTETLAAPVFIPDISAEGTFAVDSFVFREMIFKNLSGDLAYNDGIITYKNTKGIIYGGRLTADGTVDINDMYQPIVTSEFTAKNIEANEFMTQFANLSGHLYGKFNAAGRLAGRGSEPVDFINSLNATSNVNMDSGRIVNFDLIEKLADKFSFKTFEEESLKNLVTDVVIQDGKLFLDGTKMFNRLGDWNVGGTVAFIDKKLDLKVSLYLAEQYSKDMKLLGNLLQDDKGRVRVNFNIIGTYDKPDIANISTDNQVVKDKVEDKIKKEANKLLDKLFKK
ncbi:MAG: AsmA family protein [Candidatus Zixiibacteriota bacterium]